MDSTIMGNTVKLVARLEGVNKQYGTWILVREITKEKAGDHFISRKLERVRGVGISQPVWLLGTDRGEGKYSRRNGRSPRIVRSRFFSFEQKEWEKAWEVFERALKLSQEDVH